MTRHANNPDQLDLFLHSGAVMLANDVLDALLARDPRQALAGLDRLRAEDPDYREFEDLKVLCAALQDWPFPVSSPEEASKAVHRLEDGVQPAARRALAHRCEDFMRPFWLELANTVRHLPYDPCRPEAYGASLFLRAGDHRAAEVSAESIPDADGTPDALQWLALARYRSHGLEASRPVLFRLAMVAPERLAGAIRDIGDAVLQQDWDSFWAECVWLDPQGETTPCWFPAWSLLEHPGIRIPADTAPLKPTSASEVFAVLVRLLELETRGYSRALIAARSRLRDLAPELFERFMARRRSSAY